MSNRKKLYNGSNSFFQTFIFFFLNVGRALTCRFETFLACKMQNSLYLEQTWTSKTEEAKSAAVSERIKNCILMANKKLFFFKISKSNKFKSLISLFVLGLMAQSALLWSC